MPELKYIIEALLFISAAPLSLDRIRGALPEAEPAAIRRALDELAAEYEARGGAFGLRQVAGGWQLRTRPLFAPWLRALTQSQPARLSAASLETLAVVAYHQPVLRSFIEHVRGVDCGGVLKALLDRGLIRVIGRDDKPGKPLLYGTTKRFLEVFDLKDLSELPSMQEIEEMVLSPTARAALSDAGPAGGHSAEPDGREAEEEGFARPEQEQEQEQAEGEPLPPEEDVPDSQEEADY
ncbi:MAG: SMC-Scp complex subunit ScpB [Thermodesulfobacteriota bacterium]